MAEYDIKKTLNSCKRAAKRGCSLSLKQYKSLDNTMAISKEEIEKALVDINTSKFYISEASDSLTNQLKQTSDFLGYLSSSLREEIFDLQEKMSVFSITLFGKTMAGKSTLMEVLTEGNGDSIGKGAQRTTRDVRRYPWNNLEIIDVPGIGAYEGEEDEDIAFEKAKKADLILFLITDDAPQAVEAECLSKVFQLGKPVLVVLNVKSSIRDNDNPKMTLRSIDRAFDNERLESIINQFKDFGKLDGEIWENIPVVCVHLKSAFMSQKVNDESFSQALLEASHINDLKLKIIDEVETHGKYYREKNFLDIISVPSLDIFESLLFQSQTNQKLSGIVTDKKLQLEKWKERFNRDYENEISSLITSFELELKTEIPAFVDEHYDDKEADNAWSQLILEKRIEERGCELSNKIIESADNRLKEMEKSLATELKYISQLCDNRKMSIPKMHKIIDAKKAWNWGVIGVDGGLSIAGGILWLAGSTAAGPIGWIALGVGVIGTVGSILFKKYWKKGENARRQLEQNLEKNISSICEEYKKQLNSIMLKVNNERINTGLAELDRIIKLIDCLSKIQCELAEIIRPNLLEQGRQVITAALKLVWGGVYAGKINETARVPGKIIVSQLKIGEKLPKKTITRLNKLVQEELLFIDEAESYENLIASIIGESKENWTYENGLLIIKQKINSNMQNRLRILQQILGIYIEGTEI